MISPQEQGANRPSVTLTLYGDEVSVLRSLLKMFQPAGSCRNLDPQCAGFSLDADGLGMICQDCANWQEIIFVMDNMRKEIERQWQTVK